MGTSQGVVSIMRTMVVICCVCSLVLSTAALTLREPRPVPSIVTTLANAQTENTEIMKQSDHRRRVEKAKKAEDDKRQIAAFGVPDAATRDYDYLVLIVLGVSLLILALVARRRHRTGFRL
jgi:hypothetical protein